jgi:hypothetical protein
MLFFNRDKRERHARNRAKASAIVDEHGAAAVDYVRAKIDATSWQIRQQRHWLRIEKHVKALIDR